MCRNGFPQITINARLNTPDHHQSPQPTTTIPYILIKLSRVHPFVKTYTKKKAFGSNHYKYSAKFFVTSPNSCCCGGNSCQESVQIFLPTSDKPDTRGQGIGMVSLNLKHFKNILRSCDSQSARLCREVGIRRNEPWISKFNLFCLKRCSAMLMYSGY